MLTWLADNPLGAYAILGGAAILCLIGFFSTKRVLYLGIIGILALLALGLLLVDFAVETDREQVIRKTAELAEAAEKGDVARFGELISPDFNAEGRNRDSLLQLFRNYLPPNRQRTVSLGILEMNSGSQGRVWNCTCSAYAQGDLPGAQQEYRGGLELTYMKDEDGQWRVRHLVVTDLSGRQIRVP